MQNFLPLYRSGPTHKQGTYKKTRHAALVYLRFLSTEGKQKGTQG